MHQLCKDGTTGICSDLSVSFFSVFKEKPKHPPSRAQSLSYALASPDASYLSSIVRLFKNLNFVLLVITYGKVQMCPGVYLNWERKTRGLCACVSYCFQILTQSWVKSTRRASCALGPLHVLQSSPGKPFLSLSVCKICASWSSKSYFGLTAVKHYWVTFLFYYVVPGTS